MNRMIDTTGNAGRVAARIKAAGVGAVGRYYNTNNPGKNLTRAEAIQISQAGMYNVVVWENGFPIRVGYFNHAQGLADGRAAFNMAARVIRQPQGSAVYWACDYDSTEEEARGPVEAYSAGFRQAFEEEAGDIGDSTWHIGAYGNGILLSHLLEIGHISRAWLAMPKGWGGYFLLEDPNIRQTSGGQNFGLDCDWNFTNGNAGGFQIFE